MPRKDPITGCSVMTFPEFICGEAEREGKQPHEIMDEIAQSIEDDNKKMCEEYRTNALKYLQEEAKNLLDCWTEDAKHNGQVDTFNRFDFKTDQYITETRVSDAGPRPPQPVVLIEVIDVTSKQTFRSSGSKIVAKCKADDGKEYTYTLCRSDWSGSFYEPPDCDVELKWERS